MSALSKGLQILSLLGAIVSVPLIISFTKKNMTVPIAELISEAEGKEKVPEPASIPESKSVSLTKEVNQEQQAKEEVAKKKEKGRKRNASWGCFWIPEFPAELFFCFNKGEITSVPYLFHYSWRVNSTEDELKRVESIASGATANLKKGRAKLKLRKTKILPSRIIKVTKSSPFRPSEHCKITQKENESYILTYTNSSVSDTYKWEKEISKKDIVELNNSEIKELLKAMSEKEVN